MTSVYRWTPADKARLLACTSEAEMTSAFPTKTLGNLLRRRTEFAQENHKVKTKVATRPATMERRVDFALEADDIIDAPVDQEDLVPRALLTKALRERDAAKDKTREMVTAIHSSVLEASQAYTVKPLTAYKTPKKTKGTEEIAVLDIGDWQLGKVTPTYNSAVCADRVKVLGEKVKSIIEIQRADHPVNELHIRALGDIVEGEGIFATQAHVIDSSMYRQVFDAVTILTNLILDMLEVVKKVHFVGVIGNHGQVRLAGGASDPETNIDRLVYKATQMILMGPDRNPNEEVRRRVTWNIPEGKGESNWYAVDRIFSWGHLLCHGDQIRGGFAGFPFYGTAKKAWGWIDAIDEPWDELHFGHWHTPTMQTLNLRRAICNGSTEDSNTYAQEQLSAVGTPTQYLAFVHPKLHVTSQYWLDLAEAGREPSLVRGARWALPPA